MSLGTEYVARMADLKQSDLIVDITSILSILPLSHLTARCQAGVSENDSVRPASSTHELWLESQAIITSHPPVFEIC